MSLKSDPTVHLVTGANRGIGLALVQELARRPNTFVFAGSRNPEAEGSRLLRELAHAHPNVVQVVKLVAADEAGNQAAIEVIRQKFGRLDVVIANSGIFNYVGPLLKAPIASVEDHFCVNTIGPLVLFQAAHPLLAKSPNSRFVAMSSSIGTVTNMPEFPPCTPSGISKAGLNWVIKKISQEHRPEQLISLAIDPGLVDTELTRSVFTQLGVVDPSAFGLVPPADAALKILRVIQKAESEDSGKFLDLKGTEIVF